ncbi:MAG: SDR family NAD(P)-dependent oxidoreductase [Steroidobacteraceae bacterium]
MQDEIGLAGGDARNFEGDVYDEAAMRATARDIAVSFGGLDLIVNNAAPPIREFLFLEQGNGDILALCARNLAIILETARHLLPLLRTGGQFLQVRSNQCFVLVRRARKSRKCRTLILALRTAAREISTY